MSKPLSLQQGTGTSVFGSVSTATQVLGPNPSRRHLRIATTGTIFVTFDGSIPTATNGYPVTSSAPAVFDNLFIPTGAITLYSATSTPYAVFWA